MVEAVAVIIVFLVLVVFGLMWWANFSEDAGEGIASELTDLQRLEVAKQIINLPEIRCSTAGVTEVSCVDLYRLQSLSRLTDATRGDTDVRTSFEDRFFGYSFSIYTIYPADSPIHPGMDVFDFRPPETTGSVSVVVPVVVYDPVSEHTFFSMGVLTQHLVGSGVAA